MVDKSIYEMSNKELSFLIETLKDDIDLKSIKAMTILGKYPELKSIIMDLYNKDKLYKKIADIKNIINNGKIIDHFIWHEYIIDKEKNKKAYEDKISGRDLKIFLSYLLWYLRGFCDDITKKYMLDYSIKTVNDIPYGIKAVSDFLSKRKI